MSVMPEASPAPKPEPSEHRIRAWLRRRAENVIVLMLFVMFAAFMAQIIFRYFLNLPIGWASELTVVMWLWLVLFGAAFVVREQEEIRFDILYGAVSSGKRRIMAILFSTGLLVAYGFSFPAVWDYVTFMKVQSTAYMRIRFDLLFSVYILFVVAFMIRYLWILWNAVRGPAPEEFDPTKAGSGV